MEIIKMNRDGGRERRQEGKKKGKVVETGQDYDEEILVSLNFG